ncbi:MAG: acylneuraminate cytidylyltransferase family protein [Candidatus Kaiserbacteria bacterium]|nr:MAG: acylneuraminate cytidylyltransferase family protein [Candidatus Kaiserbacteria bacterium]
MEILAIIPARGGSKGVPRKNIQVLSGRPLIAWVIEAAKKSKHVTRTIVSTDDEEIAQIAKEWGAEVPFLRPVELAQDLSTDVEYLTHALETLKAEEGYEPEVVLNLRATTPLTTSADIDRGIEVLLAHPEADAVRPIIESPKHPYKALKLSEDSPYLEPLFPASVTGYETPHDLPRQLFPKAHIHTGAMDVLRPATILVQKSTSGKRLAFFHADPSSYVNIDSPADLEYAATLLARRLRKGA